MNEYLEPMQIRPLIMKHKEDHFWIIPGYMLFPWDGIIRFPISSLSSKKTNDMRRIRRFIITSPIHNGLERIYSRVICCEQDIPSLVHRIVLRSMIDTRNRKLKQGKKLRQAKRKSRRIQNAKL